MQSGNITWINSCKVICMLLVYINHSEIFYNCYCTEFGWWYRPVFVNAFFFISGYLLFRKQWQSDYMSASRKEWFSMGGKSLIYGVLCKLIVPTSVIWGFSYTLKSVLSNNFNFARFCLVTIGGESAWFTMALSVAEIVIFFLLLTRFKKRSMCIIIAIFLWGLSEYLRLKNILVFGSNHAPWYYKSGLIALTFMVAGGYYSEYEHELERAKLQYRILAPQIIIPMSLILYSVLVVLFHGKIRTALDWQGLNISGFLISIIGIFTLIEITKRMPAFKCVDYIGRHTIGLYFFSAFIPKAIAPLMMRVIPNVHNYGVTVLVALSSFVIALCIVGFINHFFPFVFDIRKIKKINK